MSLSPLTYLPIHVALCCWLKLVWFPYSRLRMGTGNETRNLRQCYSLRMCKSRNTQYHQCILDSFTPREYFSGLRFSCLSYFEATDQKQIVQLKSNGQRQQTRLSAMQAIGPSRARREHSMRRLQRARPDVGQHKLGRIHMHSVCRSA